MRAIRELKDAETAIRELYDKLSVLETQDIDMRKRRVVNASPSKHGSDYITRDELRKAIGETATKTEETAASENFDECIFGLGVNTDIAVGNDVAPKHIVSAPFTDPASHTATIEKVYGAADPVPLGQDIIVKVNRIRNDISTQLFEFTLVQNDDNVQTLATFDEDELIDEDMISIDVTQIGSTVVGGNFYLKIIYKWQ